MGLILGTHRSLEKAAGQVGAVGTGGAGDSVPSSQLMDFDPGNGGWLIHQFPNFLVFPGSC